MKLKFGFRGRLWPVRRDNDSVDNRAAGSFWGFWREYKLTFILLLVALLILLRSVITYAQEPVVVGGQVPDVVVGPVLNYSAESVRLSGFCGKLLIIDFWDTWCSACVRELPRLDSLQGEFSDKVMILPVTDQKAELVRRFLKTNGYLAHERVVTVTDDEVLGRLFPHNQLPHEVWISAAGKVLGMTTAQYVNAANIRKVLAGEKPDWMLKEDGAPIDLTRPFFATELLDRVPDGAPVYTECLTGYLKGLALKAGTVKREATTTYYFINHPLLHLYTLALGSPLPITANRRLLKVDDPQDFVYGPGQGYRNEWLRLHCFSYEATVPLRIPKEQVMQQLRSRLDAWLGLQGSIRPLLTDCLVLRDVAKRSAATAQKPGDPFLQGLSAAGLVYFLNHQAGMPPVIDESGLEGIFSLDAAAIPQNAGQWNDLLRAVGLELQPEKRMMDMFVLEKPGASDHKPEFKP